MDQTKQTVGCLDVAGIHLVECDLYEEDPQRSSLLCGDKCFRTKYIEWNCKPATRTLRDKTWGKSKSSRQEEVDDNILKHCRHTENVELEPHNM